MVFISSLILKVIPQVSASLALLHVLLVPDNPLFVHLVSLDLLFKDQVAFQTDVAMSLLYIDQDGLFQQKLLNLDLEGSLEICLL